MQGYATFSVNGSLGTILLVQKIVFYAHQTVLSLAFSIDLAKVLGINYLLLAQTASMKVPKELIQNWFLLKMLCVDITLVHPLS